MWLEWPRGSSLGPRPGGALRTDCKQGQDVNTAKFQKVFSRAPVCTTPGLRPHPKAAASREAWSNVIPQPHFVLCCDWRQMSPCSGSPPSPHLSPLIWRLCPSPPGTTGLATRKTQNHRRRTAPFPWHLAERRTFKFLVCFCSAIVPLGTPADR